MTIKTLQELHQIVITEHRCPVCNRLYIDLDDIEFLYEYGRCYVCDEYSSETIREAIYDDMTLRGFDPSNPDDVSDYYESDFDNE